MNRWILTRISSSKHHVIENQNHDHQRGGILRCSECRCKKGIEESIDSRQEEQEEHDSSSQATKHVRFHEDLRIQSYPMILGDNPSTLVPITIGWVPQRSERRIELDYFELCRQESRNTRTGDQLKRDVQSRIQLALAGGSTVGEIAQNAIEMANIQRQRAKSYRKGTMSTGLLGWIKDHCVPVQEPCILDPNNSSDANANANSNPSAPSSRRRSSASISNDKVLHVKRPPKECQFTKIPNEAHRILAEWSGQTREPQRKSLANAAA